MKKQLRFVCVFIFSFYLGHCTSNKTFANPLCATPTLTSATGNWTTITASWTENGTATSWQILVLPCGSPAPLATTPGWTAAPVNPFVITGIMPQTCYAVYVRSDCGVNGVSDWSSPIMVTTPTIPICGGIFTDAGGTISNYANNENQTVTICPWLPGDAVNVTFTSFDVESANDALYVYNGTTVTPPMQIASTNTAGNVPGGISGGYWGNTLPGPFTSTTLDGCLTFLFRSNGTITNSGWIANITCGPIPKIVLIAFVDTNNNGIKNSGEIEFTDGSFVYQLNDSGVNNYVTSTDGSYEIIDLNPSNSYDFSYTINSQLTPYLSTSTTYANISNTAAAGYQALYFPIAITNPFSDVSVAVLPNNQPRAGAIYTNTIVYKNTGFLPTSGTVTFVKDPQVAITSITPAGATATPTGFSYNYSNLNANEVRYINVNMSVPPIPTVNLGTVLTNSATVTSTVNDVNLTNNSFSNSQIVVAAYDPNDKMESHGGQIQFDQFTVNDYLYYTVRFQNEGTADALTVRIEDFLDAKIDETSIRMIDASHPYIMQRNNNHIIWTFNNINLPPTLVNEALSKGYVMFKVKLKPGFVLGDIVPNTAQIYFDTNPAIITNTFNTQFVSLNNLDFDSDNFVMYPNPAKDHIVVDIQYSNENIQQIIITDVLGKTVKSIKNIYSNETKIAISDIAKGIYLVEITTESNLKATKKLIVN